MTPTDAPPKSGASKGAYRYGKQANDLVDVATDHDSDAVRLAVAVARDSDDPDAIRDAVERFGDAHYGVAVAAVRNPDAPDDLNGWFLNHQSREVRFSLLRSDRITADDLHALRDDPTRKVLRAVAAHDLTRPDTVLAMMAAQEDGTARQTDKGIFCEEVCKRDDVPLDDVLDWLLYDPATGRFAALSNMGRRLHSALSHRTDLPADLIAHILDKAKPDAQRRLVRHHPDDPTMLRLVLDAMSGRHTDAAVEVARRTDDHDALHRLADHPDPTVRRVLVDRDDLPDDVLSQLAADDDELVARTAAGKAGDSEKVVVALTHGSDPLDGVDPEWHAATSPHNERVYWRGDGQVVVTGRSGSYRAHALAPDPRMPGARHLMLTELLNTSPMVDNASMDQRLNREVSGVDYDRYPPLVLAQFVESDGPTSSVYGRTWPRLSEAKDAAEALYRQLHG